MGEFPNVSDHRYCQHFTLTPTLSLEGEGKLIYPPEDPEGVGADGEIIVWRPGLQSAPSFRALRSALSRNGFTLKEAISCRFHATYFQINYPCVYGKAA